MSVAVTRQLQDGTLKVSGSIADNNTNTTAIINNGLVFNFDLANTNAITLSPTGQTIYTEAVRGTTGTCTSTVPTFNSANGGYVTLASNPIVINGPSFVQSDFTVETWCRMQSQNGGTNQDNSPIGCYGQNNSSNGTGAWSLLWVRPGYFSGWSINMGAFGSGAYYNAYSRQLSVSNPVANVWTQVVLTKITTGTTATVSIWIDGILAGTAPQAGYGSMWVNTASIYWTTQYRVGEGFNGDIASVRMWNRALTDQEIKYQFNTVATKSFGIITTATLTGIVSTSTAVMSQQQAGLVVPSIEEITAIPGNPFAISRITSTGTLSVSGGGFDEVTLSQTTYDPILWMDPRLYYPSSSADWQDLARFNYRVLMDQNPRSDFYFQNPIVVFDGTTSTGVLPYFPAFEASNFSIEVWCRADNPANNNTGVFNSVIKSYDTSGNTWYLSYQVPGFSGTGWKLVSNTQYQGGASIFYGYTSPGPAVTYRDNAWNHFVITRSNDTANTSYTWYTNGAVTTTTYYGGGASTVFSSGTSTFILGSTGSVSIGLLKIYDYTLTPSEVVSCFQADRYKYGV